MSEIEEIKRRLREKGLLCYEDIQILLSSLEKGKEKIDKYEIKIMQWIERCNTAEKRVKELKELVKIQNDTITFSETRINELEVKLASIKTDEI